MAPWLHNPWPSGGSPTLQSGGQNQRWLIPRHCSELSHVFSDGSPFTPPPPHLLSCSASTSGTTNHPQCGVLRGPKRVSARTAPATPAVQRHRTKAHGAVVKPARYRSSAPNAAPKSVPGDVSGDVGGGGCRHCVPSGQWAGASSAEGPSPITPQTLALRTRSAQPPPPCGPVSGPGLQ